MQHRGISCMSCGPLPCLRLSSGGHYSIIQEVVSHKESNWPQSIVIPHVDGRASWRLSEPADSALHGPGCPKKNPIAHQSFACQSAPLRLCSGHQVWQVNGTIGSAQPGGRAQAVDLAERPWTYHGSFKTYADYLIDQTCPSRPCFPQFQTCFHLGPRCLPQLETPNRLGWMTPVSSSSLSPPSLRWVCRRGRSWTVCT
jgi:hypothetical protein